MITSITDDLISRTIAQAEAWQRRANKLLTAEERAQQEQLRRLLAHPMDKVVLAELFDQSFRSRNPHRVADQVHYLLKTRGTPEFFSTAEKGLMLLFQSVGRHLPGLSIPKMVAKMRETSRRLVIPAESEALQAHLAKRKAEGVRINLNHLGEAVLGEEEAARRLHRYIEDLRDPAIEYISVKISTIYSQIHPLAFEQSVAIVGERLAQLYREAQAHRFNRRDGNLVPKFVNLDMEEFRDLGITVEAFRRTLEREEFRNHMAGIVLQAYLPESHAIQQELTAWARRRVEAGGSPIKIRIVKGANMEMEQIEAALNNWPLAPFDNKRDVDANYKRMVLFGLQPENARAVHLGIASHNLFELAFALQVAEANGTRGEMVFEMLEGMADHVRRAMVEERLPFLLYAPAADEKEFLNAIAYLIRRMDENTGPRNFLRHVPFLAVGSAVWERLAEAFADSCRRIGALPSESHRIQDRLHEDYDTPRGTLTDGFFRNEPDTDWSLPPNRQWAEEIRRRWRKTAPDEPLAIRPVIGGEELDGERPTREIVDPNQLPQRIIVARFSLAETADIDRALAMAAQDPDGWRSRSPEDRRAIFSRVAMGLRRSRGDLIGAAAAETGKLLTEADVEVSEAIDFAEYYPFSAQEFHRRKNLRITGKGVGVVVSPWNFPIAIPCGGIAAALAAGNTVIFKPSSDAVLTGWLLCRIIWEAGVSRNALQFVPCSGGEHGKQLVGDPRVDFIILTGGTDTGLRMLAERPDLFLAAETGGKNATIVTALADRDQAIKNVICSAFGHGGQKCSATSLLILEKEVYDDPQFRRTLVEAAASLPVGSAWNFRHRIGPLVRPPAGALLRALTKLEPGESWALTPRNLDGNPNLWTPGIKWGVQPGSFTHRTELFGPLLAVMRADDLDHAVQLANDTGYGLTAGIESLDAREIARWKETIRAGNLYINRGTTGAITLRQPFGGMGRSAVGPAIKAGGPNYVTQFMTITETAPPEVGPIAREHPLLALAQRWRRKAQWGQLGSQGEAVTKCARAFESYLYHAQCDFLPAHDYFHLRGQDNLLRHLPAGKVAVCVHPDDTLFEVVARIGAGRIAGCAVSLILPSLFSGPVAEFLTGADSDPLLDGVTVEKPNPAELAEQVDRYDRLRYAASERVPTAILEAAAQCGTYIARAPVMMDGRVELLHYFLNQSICDNYHRYGNLGARGLLRSAV
jgi:RHH-type proline utilization regulon transcriptional repressor/proline dehydrogenase/delta 1-pyrroline-5-carboxylate dehydrogenase